MKTRCNVYKESTRHGVAHRAPEPPPNSVYLSYLSVCPLRQLLYQGEISVQSASLGWTVAQSEPSMSCCWELQHCSCEA